MSLSSCDQPVALAALWMLPCRAACCRYVKQLKMEILTLLASSSNVYEIVGELTEYARDINPDIAREAVKAVGRIALSVSSAAPSCAAASAAAGPDALTVVL